MDMTLDQLTLEHVQSNPDVAKFIEKVVVQIYTEDEAGAIKDELVDHLYSLALDYFEAGYNQEASIHKALLQMGDPTEIGYSFTDYEAMKKRRWLLIGFKLTAIIIFTLTLMITGFFIEQADRDTELEENTDVLTDYEEFQLSLDGQGSVERFFSHVSYYVSQFSMGIFYLLYIPFIIYLNTLQHQLQGIPIKRLDISKDPILILWPYKKAFPWEYVLISLFFAPLAIIFIILMIMDGVSFLTPLAFIGSMSLATWMFFTSEKFRIPKYVILDDGILIKNRLISWVAIDKISWLQDYSSKGNHYKLIIENITNKNGSNMTIKRTVFVNRNQHKQISDIFKKYLR